MFRIFLLFGLLSNSHSHQLFPEISENFVCQPCSHPLNGIAIKLPQNHAPCVHPGQPVFEWPRGRKCAIPSDFFSDDVSFDPEKLMVFSKRRVCFYSGEWTISYRFRCELDEGAAWQWSQLRVGHERFSLQRRVKRWLKRRNPKHSPIHFQQDRYVAEIREDIEIRSTVLKVHATHANNQPLYYTLSAPEDQRSADLFALDTVTGEIRVAKKLDRETLARHVLKLSAYERLDPQVTATTTVVVDLIDVQDNRPIFEKQNYYADIREDASISTTVLSVFARDLDAGQNGEITYTLQGDEQYLKMFSINPTSGVIQTIAELDREIVNSVRIKAVATDHGEPAMSSEAGVEINILDVNDNSPIFDKPSYNVTINENVTIPLMILKITATDADSGANGEVHYSIVTSSSLGLFSLDYDSGELTLRAAPDPRQTPYSILVRAKDGGQPAMSTTAHVTVNIVDINDHAPTFLGATSHEINVEENLPAGRELGRLFAMDEDSGKNGEVRYFLKNLDENSNETDAVVIDEISGALRTNIMLDRELKSRYEYKIIAKDQGEPPLETSIQLTVTVIDVNDNAPKFEKDTYELTMSENSPKGTQILDLRATDADADQQLSYRIESADKPLFALISMGADQGAVLSLTQSFSPLDERIKLVISATDQGGLKGFTNVTITITDENSAPVFVDTPVSVKVSESAEIGSPVVQIKARDNDRGANSELIFSIDSADFLIDNSTGLITLAKRLDREAKASYSMTVTVTDSGVPPMSSSTVLEIFVEDVNDNAPKFLLTEYTARIKEDMPVGTSFLQVQAIDPDEGQNGVVDYFLNETDQFVKLDAFRLDRTSGLLRIHKPLDRESNEKHILPVIAQDRGNPQQISHATVTIELEDVNDNAPQFEKPSYSLWIAENSPIGTIVGTLVATDADIGPNSHIDFKIFGGSDAKLFEIETDPQQNGVVRIRSRAEFDYEAKNNKFFVELQASSGQLSSTVPITIHVSDVNDNKPQLNDFVVLVAHFEDEISDSASIGSVPAFDPDQNATLEFYLEPNQLLDVEPFSGALRLKGHWKRQLNAENKACVSDGPNTVCATARIIYVAVDENSLRNSVSFEILDMNRDSFLESATFDRFIASITALDQSWLPEDVRVFGVESVEVNGKQRLNVSLFVSQDEMAVNPHRIESADQTALSASFDHPIRILKDDMCVNEPCAFYQQCRRTLRYDKTQPALAFETDNFLFRSLATIRSFKCECPQGFTTSPTKPGVCNERLDLCFNNPCLNNGSCVSLESSYRCECPAGRIGKHCELSEKVDTCLPNYCHSGAQCDRTPNREQKCLHCPWTPLETDSRCRLRSLSFNGDGYLAVPHEIPRMEFRLDLTFATTSQNSVLFYASHSADNFDGDMLELILQGAPRLRASLGGSSMVEVALPDWKENRVSDGEWHTIHISYRNLTFRLWLDDCDAELALNHADKVGYKKCAAEAKISLPARCNDPAVPCHRFLDLSSALYLGAQPKHVENGFVGCLKDLRIDGKLVHFSDFKRLEKVGDVQAGCRRFRPDHCALQRALIAVSKEEQISEHVARGMMDEPCHPTAKCQDQWEGRVCKCPHRLHSHRSCAMETSHAISLLSEESYVVWRLPAEPKNSVLYFEFRTREKKTQVMVMEFEMKTDLFMFSLESGHGSIRYGQEQFFLSHPDLSDGEWHSVRVDFESDTLIVDHIHARSMKPTTNVKSQSLHTQFLYSGNAPSMAYPSEFLGCLRNVEVGGVKLKPHEQSKTKPGCSPATNPCSQHGNICPPASSCQKQWDRHRCECSFGHVGDACLDICSVEGICNQGLCIRTNLTEKGYECACPEGRSGENCEAEALEQECPPGWFGVFGQCKICNCRMDRGFLQQCDEISGQCKCRPGFYRQNDRCLPCECGYGAESPQCHSETGQCQCAGEATGRRCDRCPTKNNRPQLLERKSLKCQPLKDRCPAEIELGIQWASTVRGVVARQSCPHGQMGIATRLCRASGEWAPAKTYNCTSSVLYELAERVNSNSNTGITAITRSLENLTVWDATLATGRNLDLAIGVLSSIIKTTDAATAHATDHRFTRTVLKIADNLLDQKLNAVQFLGVLSRLYEFGSTLSRIHADMPFIRPFVYYGQEFVFAIDIINEKSAGIQLPKYQSLIAPEANRVFSRQANDFYSNQGNGYSNSDGYSREPIKNLHVNLPTQNSAVFYSFVRPQCKDCGNGDIVLLKTTPLDVKSSSYDGMVQLTFRRQDSTIDEDINSLKYPECVQAAELEERLSSERFRKNQNLDGANVGYSNLESLHDPYSINSKDFSSEISFDWTTATSSGQLMSLNRTHAVCRFATDATKPIGGIFTLLSKSDNSAIIQFTIGRLPYTAPLCAAFALFLLLLSVLATIFRRDIGQRLVKLAFLGAFIFNAGVLFFLPRLQFNSIFCGFRTALLVFSSSGEFSWLFLLTLHIYRILVEERAKTNYVFSFIFGLLAPCISCTAIFFLSEGCTLQPGSRNLWLLIAPVVLLLMFSFYALATSFIVSFSKQYDVIVAKHGLKKMLASHAILLILCTVHVTVSVYYFIFWTQHTFLIEGITNVVLVFVAIYIFIWSNFLSKMKSANRKSEFWLDSEQKIAPANLHQNFLDQPDAHSPLLHTLSNDSSEYSQKNAYGEAVNDHMSDVNPYNATYVHHTLQRSLKLQQNSILSPVPPLPRSLGAQLHDDLDSAHSSPYTTRSPLLSHHLDHQIPRTPELAQRDPGSHFGTMRSTMDSPARSRFGSAVDEGNDIYYSFTGRRKRSTQACTTFS
uniref:Cadherin EGF LAG seven-pass G-type receptor 2 n=2 Tax=Bursaphelenchus xylophilus TaxID=6326 RepID=A0A1I7RLZ2_BURXY